MLILQMSECFSEVAVGAGMFMEKHHFNSRLIIACKLKRLSFLLHPGSLGEREKASVPVFHHNFTCTRWSTASCETRVSICKRRQHQANSVSWKFSVYFGQISKSSICHLSYTLLGCWYGFWAASLCFVVTFWKDNSMKYLFSILAAKYFLRAWLCLRAWIWARLERHGT